ncbi:surface antigen-domain-containing protein [Irpex lacteus]|nr:surface antigen-domain-containing protein [Irpex lacteus]
MGETESELTVPPLKPPLHNTSAPRDMEPTDADLEKLRRWQEERIARKLRGEYQSAVLRLAEIVNDNIDSPLRLASVRVEGAAHTRKSFLGTLVNPYLHSEPTSQSLSSILHDARAIGHLLNETDLFNSVFAKVERSREPLAQPNDVELVFQTREKPRMFLKTSTEIGNNEGGASATCRVRNAFGGAETFEANLSFGTTTRVAFNAALSAPLAALTGNLKTRGEVSVFGLERDNTFYCSAMEGVRGLKAVVRNGTLRGGLHEVGYEGVLRHIGNLQPTASVSMREAAGQSIKSSVFHTWTRDTRDDSLYTTRGYFLRAFHEFAGLGGDASFYKSEGQAHFARPLLPGLTVSLAAKAGLLLPVGEKPTLFSDRFQLGGPSNVRMFRTNSMGPRDGSDSLGGDIYWSAGLSLISDIPKKPQWPVKLHGFANAGRLDCVDKSKPLQDSLVSTLSKPSISAGLGIVYRLDPVRVEMNFGLPLVAAKHEGARRGFQLGIGLEFL